MSVQGVWFSIGLLGASVGVSAPCNGEQVIEDLSGRYVASRGDRVTELRIEQSGRVAIAGHTGGRHDRDQEGWLRNTGSRLWVVEDKEGQELGSYVFVRWAQRRYLVRRDRMMDSFVNLINSGVEPRRSAFGFVLLAAGDWDKPVSGLPELPDEVAPCVHESAVRLRLVAHLGNGRVTVDAGASAGLCPGMVLYAVDGSVDNSVTIQDVSGQSSVGALATRAAPLPAGALLSTRPKWAPSAQGGQR
jgi:hypothetical protein